VTSQSPSLGFAVSAACGILHVGKLADAYPRRGVVWDSDPGEALWSWPPFLPKGFEVFAPGFHRLRFFQGHARPKSPMIFKWHRSVVHAQHEWANAGRLAAAIDGRRVQQGSTTVLIEVLKGQVVAGTAEGWLALPVINHVTNLGAALLYGHGLSRDAAVSALAAVVHAIEDAGASWRGLAPRNILLIEATDVVNVMLCDFERGNWLEAPPRRLQHLEEVSFCLEEVVNYLTESELKRVFRNDWNSLASDSTSFEMLPAGCVDSNRQRLLLRKFGFYSDRNRGSVCFEKLMLVRAMLRRWQRAEIIAGVTIDPIPLLDSVTAGLTTSSRLRLSERIGELGSPDVRLNLLMRMKASAQVLTVLDLLDDVGRHGRGLTLKFNSHACRLETVEWLMQDVDTPPPGARLLASAGVDALWLNQILGPSA